MSTPITISTTVHSPIDTVWKAWILPEHIMNWNFASPDWHCPKATNDFRIGGAFVATMAARDGSMSFDFGGTYTSIVEHDKIAYTIGDGRTVEVLFEETPEGIKIVETFDAE